MPRASSTNDFAADACPESPAEGVATCSPCPVIEISSFSSVASLVVISATLLPLRRTVTLFPISLISSSLWEMKRMAWFAADNCRIRLNSRSTSWRPRAAVGSSMTMILASSHSARGIITPCWSPTESVPMSAFGSTLWKPILARAVADSSWARLSAEQPTVPTVQFPDRYSAPQSSPAQLRAPGR